MNFLSYYDTYLIFIIAIKILFLISAVEFFYFSYFSKSPALALQFEKWKEFTENIFITSMTILLLYLFYPRKSPIYINQETNLLLFVFGCILMIDIIKKAYSTYI